MVTMAKTNETTPKSGDKDVSVVKVCPTAEKLGRKPTNCDEGYICNVPGCFQRVKTIGGLTQHTDSCHPELSWKGGRKKGRTFQFYCPEEKCVYNPALGRFFSTWENIKAHYASQHWEKHHECSKCGKKFGMERDWRRHEADCGTKFICASCGASYPSRQALLVHCRRKQHPPPTGTGSTIVNSAADGKGSVPGQVLQNHAIISCCSDNTVGIQSERTLRASHKSPAKTKGSVLKASNSVGSGFSPKTSSPRPILPKATITTASILPLVGQRVETRDAVCGPRSPQQISAQIQTDIQDFDPCLQRLLKEGVSRGSQAGGTMVGNVLVVQPDRQVAVANTSTQVSGGLRSWGNLPISSTGTQVSVDMVNSATQVVSREACILTSRRVVDEGTQASLTLVSNGVQINFGPVMTAVAVQTAEDGNMNVGAEASKSISASCSMARQLPLPSCSLPEFLGPDNTSSSAAVQVSLPIILLSRARSLLTTSDTEKAFDPTTTTTIQTSVGQDKQHRAMAETQTSGDSSMPSISENSHVHGQTSKGGRKVSLQPSCKRRILTSAETQTKGNIPDKRPKRGKGSTHVKSLDSTCFEQADMENLAWNLDLSAMGAEEMNPNHGFADLLSLSTQTKLLPVPDAKVSSSNVNALQSQTRRSSDERLSECTDEHRTKETFEPFLMSAANSDPLLSATFLSLSGFSDGTQNKALPIAADGSGLHRAAAAASMRDNEMLSSLQPARDAKNGGFCSVHTIASVDCADCDVPPADVNKYFEDLLASSPPAPSLTTDTGMQAGYDCFMPSCTSELGVQTQDDFLLACTSDFGVQTQDSFLDVCTADLGVQTASGSLDCLLPDDLDADLSYDSLGYPNVFTTDIDIQTMQSSADSLTSSTDSTLVDCGIGTDILMADTHTQTSQHLSPRSLTSGTTATLSTTMSTLIANVNMQTSQHPSLPTEVQAVIPGCTSAFSGTIGFLSGHHQACPESSHHQCCTIANNSSRNEFLEVGGSLSSSHPDKSPVLSLPPGAVKADKASVQGTDMHTQTADDLLNFLMTNMETQTTDGIFERNFGLTDIQTQTATSDLLFGLTANAGGLAHFSGNCLVTTETQTGDQLTDEEDSAQFFSQFADMQTQTSFNILDVCEGTENSMNLQSQFSDSGAGTN